MRVVNWNVEWARKHRDEILRRVNEHAPDVICLTETHIDFLPAGGHQIESQADYGYPVEEGRRKVVLWSRQPWIDVDTEGNSSLPTGRFVSGKTTSDLGEVTVIGVCIPWSKAHVDSGRRDREAWEDHISYLNGLEHILGELGSERLLVVGDFNQRMSGRWVPDDAENRLKEVLSNKLEIATGGIVFSNQEAIDHVAHTKDLVSDNIKPISNESDAGKLSDHFGLALSLLLQHGQ